MAKLIQKRFSNWIHFSSGLQKLQLSSVWETGHSRHHGLLIEDTPWNPLDYHSTIVLRALGGALIRPLLSRETPVSQTADVSFYSRDLRVSYLFAGISEWTVRKIFNGPDEYTLSQCNLVFICFRRHKPLLVELDRVIYFLQSQLLFAKTNEDWTTYKRVYLALRA